MKYILMGAGAKGIEALHVFGGNNVFCFCDNYIYGIEVENKKVISFDELKGIYAGYRVVITPIKENAKLELMLQLNDFGIEYTLFADEVRLLNIYHNMETYTNYTKEWDDIEYKKRSYNLIREYDHIEFSYIDISRIGEMMALLVSNTGGRCNKSRIKTVYVPLFVMDGKELLLDDDRIANKYLYNKIGEKLEVLNKDNVRYWFRFLKEKWLMCRFNYKYNHTEMMRCQQAFLFRRESYDGPYLCWNEHEIKSGENNLAKMGIDKPYVCFFARSQKYLNTIFQRDTIHPNDFFRNQPVENYKLMAKELQGQGVMAVRMGYMVDCPVNWSNTIDYASSFRSEFMDLYTISKAEMFISCPSGIQHIALMYNVPNVIVDLNLFTSCNDISLWTKRDRDIMIFQKLRDANGDYLTLKEIFTIEELIPNHYERMAYYYDNGFILEKNTPKEIWEVTKEMLDIKHGNIQYTEEDIYLQRRYWKLVDRFLNRRKNKLNWFANARVGRDFLRKNNWLLE